MSTTWSSRVDGLCLVTDSGVFLQSLSPRLFVRPCYPDLFAICETIWMEGTQGIFLLGTPGIGKSCFLDYVLHRCLYDANGQNVLYLHGPRDRAFVFQHVGGTIAVAKHNLSAVLSGSIEIPPDSFDVVLYDPHESAERTNDVHISFFTGKNFIVPISPDKENCKKLRKDTRCQATLYMGTLSMGEAEDMRESCYPAVTADLLQTRYRKIGGIARYLYRPPRPMANDVVDQTVEDVQKNQQFALNDIAQNPLRIDAGEVAADFKNLWSLYHLQPTLENGRTNFQDYTIEFVREDVRARIRDKLMNKDVNELWNLFISTMERHGTLKGIRYEAYAHKKIIAHGVNLEATLLTKAGVGRSRKQIKIPASLPKINLLTNDLGEQFQTGVNSARELRTGGLRTGGYLLPSNSNFPVVDSLFASPKPKETLSLQMKAGRSKPLSGPSATSIQAAAGGCLVFVVPDESIILRKLRYSEGDGPAQWKQYRLVLKQP